MGHFTPLASLTGGVLIGLACAAVLFLHGRLVGISGICSGLLRAAVRGEAGWRAGFVVGLVAVGAVAAQVAPAQFDVRASASLPLLAVSGVLVGFGTRLANGCTSGHGICGLSRLSKRSFVATLTFMATGALTVFALRHVLGQS